MSGRSVPRIEPQIERQLLCVLGPSDPGPKDPEMFECCPFVLLQ